MASTASYSEILQIQPDTDAKSDAQPRYYYPIDRLLGELTRLWPRIPPHLQARLLQLARQFAS